jgi:hypothetical protein
MDEIIRRRLKKIDLDLPTNDAAVATGSAITEGILAGSTGNSLAQWLANHFNHNFDEYDRTVDSVYNAMHVGGSSYHHIIDGQHDIFRAFAAVHNVSADDTWLTELCRATEHLIRDTMSVAGINPLFSLTPQQFDHLADLVSHVGISKPYLADALTINGPELLGGSVALAASLLLSKKPDPARLSTLAGGCAISALASANPLLMPIAAGSLAYAAYKSQNPREAILTAGKGALVSGSVILVSHIVGGPVWLGCVAGVITAVAVKTALDDPHKAFQRAQELIAPAEEVLKKVTAKLYELAPVGK